MLNQSALIKSTLANLGSGPMAVQNPEAPLEEHDCVSAATKKQMKAGVFCVVKFISERGTANTVW